MSRYLTPSKVALLVLISAYASDVVAKQDRASVLSFIITRVLQDHKDPPVSRNLKQSKSSLLKTLKPRCLPSSLQYLEGQYGITSYKSCGLSTASTHSTCS